MNAQDEQARMSMLGRSRGAIRSATKFARRSSSAKVIPRPARRSSQPRYPSFPRQIDGEALTTHFSGPAIGGDQGEPSSRASSPGSTWKGETRKRSRAEMKSARLRPASSAAFSWENFPNSYHFTAAVRRSSAEGGQFAGRKIHDRWLPRLVRLWRIEHVVDRAAKWPMSLRSERAEICGP